MNYYLYFELYQIKIFNTANHRQMQNRISKLCNDRWVLLSCPKRLHVWNVVAAESHNRSREKRKYREKKNIKVNDRKKGFFLLASHREEIAFGYWNQKGSLWTGGGRVGGVGGGWFSGWVGRLVSWLVARSERANVAPCASSLYLDDKEPNLTQWNGRMVMETAFNLHRRSLFVDSLKVGVLLARPGPSRFPPRALFRIPPLRDEKGIVLYLSSTRSYILFRLRVARVQNGESLYDCPSPPIVTMRGPTAALT